jgi:two-component system phosphate regulon sensor histidine kinase PhoR
MNSAVISSEAISLTGADQMLQKLLDTTRECVLVVDRDMRVSNCNVPAAVAFGREGIDIENKRLSEVIRDLDVHEAFRRAINGEISSDVRLELTRTDKRKFDVHVAPIDLNDEIHAIGFFYETTQIDRLESIRQEFLSNISHELRTPLTSILAFVETLEDGGIDDQDNNRRFLSVIRRNAERMHMLIADILELSQIESGNVSIEIRDVDLAAAINDVANALAAHAADREIALINNVPPGTIILADIVRLEQMLTNLMDNAIKFNRQGGSVTVTYERADGRDIISVSDTGEGILPEHATRIFERFYRADRARSREVGGTGLGLAIVKHLAKLHGGEVSVSSTLGQGTTFRVQLPAKA